MEAPIGKVSGITNPPSIKILETLQKDGCEFCYIPGRRRIEFHENGVSLVNFHKKERVTERFKKISLSKKAKKEPPTA
jgi:hypothetical protein